MTRYFSIKAKDLDWSTYDSILRDIKEGLIDDYQLEGEALLKQEWHDPQPESWQEAFLRDISNDEHDDWEQALEDYADDEADTALSKASLELEVTL